MGFRDPDDARRSLGITLADVWDDHSVHSRELRVAERLITASAYDGPRAHTVNRITEEATNWACALVWALRDDWFGYQRPDLDHARSALWFLSAELDRLEAAIDGQPLPTKPTLRDWRLEETKRHV